MLIISKTIYRFHYNPYQNTSGTFQRTRTNNPRFYMESPKTLNSQSNLEKEQSWRYYIPWFQTIYKRIVIKTVWYQHKNRDIKKWKRVESTEINPHLHSLLIQNKWSKTIKRGNDSLFNKWCWTTLLHYIQKKSK